ncbi:hypothetical protein CKO43_18645 [Rubrivivax gelatinosus]|uniref:DUF3299 domain-containing protein n=1 Tax=Rubrivivax gelatinosus TaxID=28068 RepID=A0ABS1DZ35_RUBGE|nr:hypothetical protein [Rubrivivax gelatinosus]
MSAAAGTRRRFVVGAALLPFVRTARADELLSFDTLYKSVGVLGIQYSERALALRGQPVRMRGYMAPPLKPESRFFVLTREPVAVCPFCASDAEWPVDIVVVYLRDTLAPVDFNRRVEASGRLEIGSRTDPTTGFVSQVRLVDAQVHEAGR